MDITSGNIILIGSILLFLSILAGQRAYKYGIPALVLFLSVGMLAGSDGIGGIHFDNSSATQLVGVVALNFILFSGGLDTEWRSVRPIMWQGVTLSTIGVLLTALLTGLFIHWVTDFTLYEGLLLGSIVSSTDAAAVFSILRSKNLSLKNNLRPILEFESGSNDPMAYLLTIACLGLVMQPDASVSQTIVHFFIEIGVGGAAGIGFGMVMVWVARNVKLGYAGLYPVMTIALMYFTYAATERIEGNGFLAVYLSALWLGNHRIPHRGSLLNFFDGFAWLMQIILFLTLGLLVFPSQVVPVIGIGLLISAVMIFVVRPVSVFASLLFFRKMSLRSKAFISWVGLRGAVPIVFATYPLIAGIDKAGMIFNIVFFISLTSILVQGTTLPLFARWLGVLEPEEKPIGQKPEMDPSEVSDLTEITVVEGNAYVGRQVSDVPFPDGARITLLRRGHDHAIVTGSTVLEAGDRLIIASHDRDNAQQVYELFTNVDTPVDAATK